MEKEFIPYEQALELKKLGFDEHCNTCYDKLQMVSSYGKDVFDYKNYNTSGYVVSRPTFSQAFRWFRENKLSDCYVYRYQERTDGSINYGYSILNNFGIEETRFIKENYTSYEEAELACLKHLIKIINEKD
jgi:hypothetical protein